MKKVLLIGDSTVVGSYATRGYGCFLSQMLSGCAEVVLPVENCQDTRFTRACLDELFLSRDIESADVIHWNNGLWDVIHFMGSARNAVPIDLYCRLLGEILDMIRAKNPRARVVFATTIPIDEGKEQGSSYRKNDEIAEYNAEAVGLLKLRGVEINDLNSVCQSFGAEAWVDGVHLSDDNSKLLAEHTARLILSRF